MFIRFDIIHERDRQTYRRTLHDGIGRFCIATFNDITSQQTFGKKQTHNSSAQTVYLSLTD